MANNAIALGVNAFKMPDPAEGQNQSLAYATNMMALRKAAKAAKDEEVLRQAYSDPEVMNQDGTVNFMTLSKKAIAAGRGDLITSIQEQALKTQKAMAENQNLQLTGRKTSAEIDGERLKNVSSVQKQITSSIMAAPSPEAMMANGQALASQFPEYAAAIQQELATLPKDGSPESYRTWQMTKLRASMDAEHQLEQQYEKIDTGGGVSLVATSKYAGGAAPTTAATYTKTADPNTLAMLNQGVQFVQDAKGNWVGLPKNAQGALSFDGNGNVVGGAAGNKGGFENIMQSYMFPVEGGYTSRDGGSGAPANFGINQAANPDIDVKNLTKEQAAQIYRERYWGPSGAEQISDPRLQAVHFDSAVNMGVEKAKQLLAQSGGDVGKYMQLRQQHYDALVRSNPKKYGSSKNAWADRQQRLQTFVNAPGAQGLTPVTGQVTAATAKQDGTAVRTPAAEDKFLKDMSKNYAVTVSAERTLNEVITAAQALKKQSPEDLARITGFTGKNWPAWARSPAGSRVMVLYNNLSGVVTGMAKAAASASGAIGPIATQEWGILQKQIADLDLANMDPTSLNQQLDIIVTKAKDLLEQQRDVYNTTYAQEFADNPRYARFDKYKVGDKYRQPAGGAPSRSKW